MLTRITTLYLCQLFSVPVSSTIITQWDLALCLCVAGPPTLSRWWSFANKLNHGLIRFQLINHQLEIQFANELQANSKVEF